MEFVSTLHNYFVLIVPTILTLYSALLDFMRVYIVFIQFIHFYSSKKLCIVLVITVTPLVQKYLHCICLLNRTAYWNFAPIPISYFLIVDCSLDQSLGEGQVYLDLLMMMMRGMKMMMTMMMMKMMKVKTQMKQSLGGRKQ